MLTYTKNVQPFFNPNKQEKTIYISTKTKTGKIRKNFEKISQFDTAKISNIKMKIYSKRNIVILAF